MNVLLSSRLKLDRAQEHIDAVEEAIEAWLDTDAYTIGSEIDPETGYTVRRAQIKFPPPARISVLIGDAVQNLRTALDHAIYALAETNGTLALDVQERLMFPIVGHQNRKGEPADGAEIYARISNLWLEGVPDQAKAFIETEQPYHWGVDAYRGHWLWTLHELNRIDKHRRLTITTAFLGLQFVASPEGVEPKVTFHRATGPVQDGDPLVTYSGAEEGVNAQFTRGVALQDGALHMNSVEQVLESVGRRVQWIVAVLERFL